MTSVRKTISKSKELPIEDAVILLETLRDLYNKPDTSPELKGIITRTLVKDVLYDLSENRSANLVSEDALKLWQDNNLTSKFGELKKLSVSTQRYNKQKYGILKNFILEHSNPLSELIKRIFIGPEDIRNILEHELITTWITKAEDNELNDKGFRSKRKFSHLGDWRLCYDECKIIVRD